MKNITELFRDLFVPRQWKIVKELNVVTEKGISSAIIYVLQDQYGNIKQKQIQHSYY